MIRVFLGNKATGEPIDVPVAVRGAAVGFSVLIVGGLVRPVVRSWAPVLGIWWIPLVTVVAFAVASCRIGKAALPAVHGAVAALCSYLLAFPFSLFVPAGRDPVQILLIALIAVLTGSLVGFLRGLMRA
ncbi:hypothetical protein [Amycolatopsis sp. SID8362]|uniref:hypothetical protein n=1 Tax=Amycolatopsis sp. SID8362 TaxID=2690346 RepID=UPI0013681991|nr:hypothetical protein [Amycolatopsis sp. SID8362]NBH07496.1 hypothetical protein [Amycolatopsis sp. SID8362]NED44192.1 hypothetical protein [Amycolatopsis sp. SID8362]